MPTSKGSKSDRAIRDQCAGGAFDVHPVYAQRRAPADEAVARMRGSLEAAVWDSQQAMHAHCRVS